MRLKLKVEELEFDDILSGLQARFKAATDATIQDAQQEAQTMAGRRLKSGLKKWLDGFSFHKVSDGFYIISIEGKIANWMEDGIQPGEISKAIMDGNRAEANKGEGKNYVDVPIGKDADSMGSISLGKKGSGPKVNVKAFANADALLKNINSSDWKKGGIKQKQVIQSRVKDIIKNVEPKTKSASYMTIRRVTPESQWPKSAFKGAKVLDDLGLHIERNFSTILERFL